MKRSALSIALLTVFCFSAAIAQPKLEIVGGDTYNWGTVKATDTPLKAPIKLKNTGDKKLIIQNVKPGCGCTNAPLDKQELNPGETTTMNVTLNLTARTAPITKTITITSTDPQKPTTVLYLKADVINELDVLPSNYMSFNDMKIGTVQEGKVKIKNNSKKTVTLSDFKTVPDDININLSGQKTLKPGEEIELVAKVKPNKVGYYNCTISMKTTNSSIPELKIQGYGQVKESPVFNNNQGGH